MTTSYGREKKSSKQIAGNRKAPFYPWCSELVNHPILLVSFLF